MSFNQARRRYRFPFSQDDPCCSNRSNLKGCVMQGEESKNCPNRPVSPRRHHISSVVYIAIEMKDISQELLMLGPMPEEIIYGTKIYFTPITGRRDQEENPI